MKKALIAVIILLALSISGNVVLITMKGIVINKTFNQQQYQNQSQSQVMINMMMQKGDFKWILYGEKEFAKMNINGNVIEQINKFLNTLPAYQSLFAKVYSTQHLFGVFVPILKKDIKKIEVYK